MLVKTKVSKVAKKAEIRGWDKETTKDAIKMALQGVGSTDIAIATSKTVTEVYGVLRELLPGDRYSWENTYARLLELHDQGNTWLQVSAKLNKGGYRTERNRLFTRQNVALLYRKHGRDGG